MYQLNIFLSFLQTTLHERFLQIQEENQSLKAKLESQKDTVYQKQRQSGMWEIYSLYSIVGTS
jgi:hypothetical protein